MVPLATNGTIGKISNGTIGRITNARIVRKSVNSFQPSPTKIYLHSDRDHGFYLKLRGTNDLYCINMLKAGFSHDEAQI